MTTKADLPGEEWEAVAEAPPLAGLAVMVAQRGGLFRETLAMARTYAEARREQGQSELLDELVSTRPELEATRYRSPDEVLQAALERLRSALAVLERKATPQERDEYRAFVSDVAERVAAAHREQGAAVSEAEQRVLDQLGAVLAGS